MFNYIAYRIYEYFHEKENKTAIPKTINFLALFQGTLIVPIFIAINLVFRIPIHLLGEDSRIVYYIGIPFAVILMVVNTVYFKEKLKGERLKTLKDKYQKEKYLIPTWVIIATPVIFVFVIPIFYGVLNGTISFPLLVK